MIGGSARPFPAPEAPASDADRRHIARRWLRPDDAEGWALWEALVGSSELLDAEAADRSVEPGSLARQAQGLARRLRAAVLAVDVGLEVVGNLACELATARTALARWKPPTMAAVSKRLGDAVAARALRAGRAA